MSDLTPQQLDAAIRAFKGACGGFVSLGEKLTLAFCAAVEAQAAQIDAAGSRNLVAAMREQITMMRSDDVLPEVRDVLERPASMMHMACSVIEKSLADNTIVAVVREQLDDNRAIIEWLYNPVPEGAGLHWLDQ